MASGDDTGGGEASKSAPPIPVDPEAAALRQQALKQIETSLDPHSFNTWLRPTQGSSVDEHEPVVLVPNVIFRDWLESHYLVQAVAAAGRGVRF